MYRNRRISSGGCCNVSGRREQTRRCRHQQVLPAWHVLTKPARDGAGCAAARRPAVAAQLSPGARTAQTAFTRWLLRPPRCRRAAVAGQAVLHCRARPPGGPRTLPGPRSPRCLMSAECIEESSSSNKQKLERTTCLSRRRPDSQATSASPAPDAVSVQAPDSFKNF